MSARDYQADLRRIIGVDTNSTTLEEPQTKSEIAGVRGFVSLSGCTSDNTFINGEETGDTPTPSSGSASSGDCCSGGGTSVCGAGTVNVQGQCYDEDDVSEPTGTLCDAGFTKNEATGLCIRDGATLVQPEGTAPTTGTGSGGFDINGCLSGFSKSYFTGLCTDTTGQTHYPFNPTIGSRAPLPTGSSGGNTSTDDDGTHTATDLAGGQGTNPPKDVLNRIEGVYDCTTNQAITLNNTPGAATPTDTTNLRPVIGTVVGTGSGQVPANTAAGLPVSTGGATIVVTSGSGTWSAWDVDEDSGDLPPWLYYPQQLKVTSSKIYINDSAYTDNRGTGYFVTYTLIDETDFSNPVEMWVNDTNGGLGGAWIDNTPVENADGSLNYIYNTNTQRFEADPTLAAQAGAEASIHPTDMNACDQYGNIIDIGVANGGGLVYTYDPQSNGGITYIVRDSDGKITAAGSGSTRDIYLDPNDPLNWD